MISHRPQAGDADDVDLLRTVADHLAATVAAAQLLANRRRLLSGGRDLTALALRLNGTVPDEEALRQLAQVYRAASGAVGVCVVGMGRDLLVGEERLQAIAPRVRA